jgi:hypothetical protein
MGATGPLHGRGSPPRLKPLARMRASTCIVSVARVSMARLGLLERGSTWPLPHTHTHTRARARACSRAARKSASLAVPERMNSMLSGL